MALNGTLVQLPQGKIGFAFKNGHYREPKITTHVWEIAAYKWRGSYVDVKDAIGKPATLHDGRVSCYMGNGSYIDGALEHGGQTQAISVETTDAAPPKVRKGIEIRWQDGRWQKYSKKDGWVAA